MTISLHFKFLIISVQSLNSVSMLVDAINCVLCRLVFRKTFQKKTAFILNHPNAPSIYFNRSYQDICFIGDGISNFLSNVGVLGRALQIIPGVAAVVHEGEEVVIHADQLVVFALDIRHFHVVGGGADILKFLSWKRQLIEHSKMGSVAFTNKVTTNL